MITLFDLRYRRHVLAENAVARVARALPMPLRRAVIVDAACRATTREQVGPNGYAGPDGLDYKRLWEAADLPR